ncbi:MAG TPA: tetratricopeptide repeat protein, partial [Thermoanaerobaculia bacterium]
AGGGQGGGPGMAEIQQLRDYVAKNPNDADAVHKLADLNAQIQNWPRAQELYAHYLELKPNDPEVMTDLGLSYRGEGKLDQALTQFHQVQKVAPDHWPAYFYEVVVLALDLKRYNEAEPILTHLQKMQPSNPDVARLTEAVARQRNTA